MADDREEDDPPLVRESLDELKVDRLGGDDRGRGQGNGGEGSSWMDQEDNENGQPRQPIVELSPSVTQDCDIEHPSMETCN
jgi:hypothetical protein